jgi:hypothetical protein
LPSEQTAVIETPVFFRNSERSTYRECFLKWDWKYNKRLNAERPKGNLSFGRLAHKALEVYYPPGRKRGPHPARTFEQLMEEAGDTFSQWDDEGNRYDATELGVAMLEGYVEQYGDDDHIEIIQPEMPLSVHIYDKRGNYLCTFVGRGDACYRDLSASNKRRDRLGFLEHKTAKQIEHNLRVNSGYGDQAENYWWLGTVVLRDRGLLQADQSVDHVLVNWLRKGMPDTRPRNAQGHRLNKPSKQAMVDYCVAMNWQLPKGIKVDELFDKLEAAGCHPELLGEVSKTQPTPLFERVPLDFGDEHLEQTGWRIRAEAWELAQRRAGKLPIYKNPTKDCSWKCEFVDACELHEMGADWESMLELEFVTWDPYEDHEEETK